LLVLLFVIVVSVGLVLLLLVLLFMLVVSVGLVLLLLVLLFVLVVSVGLVLLLLVLLFMLVVSVGLVLLLLVLLFVLVMSVGLVLLLDDNDILYYDTTTVYFNTEPITIISMFLSDVGHDVGCQLAAALFGALFMCDLVSVWVLSNTVTIPYNNSLESRGCKQE
jgi:energy-coupling factor transporter transmembrane protein EcfT